MADGVVVTAEHAVGGKEHDGTDAFASESEGVVDGLVEPLGFVDELLVGKDLIDLVEERLHEN